MKIDDDIVRAVVADFGLGQVAEITAQPGGNNPLFRLVLSDGGQLLLKIYKTENAVHKDTYAAKQLAGIGLARTEYLAVDSTRSRLPVPYAITSYLPGMAVRDYRDHPDVTAAYRGMGELLAAMHAVEMPGYGQFASEGIIAPVASHETLVRDLIGHTFERFAAMGAEPVLTQRLRAIVEDRFDAIVTHSVGPVFAHDDLHPGNVLAVEDAQGRLRLSGLIDFGNAKAGDAVSDIAKCLFCCEHDAPGSTPHILAGYGPIYHPDPEAALGYYTLLHRMVMWWWLRQEGFIPAADAQSDLMDALRVAAA